MFCFKIVSMYTFSRTQKITSFNSSCMYLFLHSLKITLRTHHYILKKPNIVFFNIKREIILPYLKKCPKMYDFVLIERVGTDKNNRYNPKQPIYNLIDFKGLSVLDS